MTRRDLIWIPIVVLVGLSGLLYSELFYSGSPVGAVYAVFTILPLILFERGLFLRRFRQWTNALSTPAYIAIKVAVFYVLFHIGSLVSGLSLWSLGLVGDSLREAAKPSFSVWLYSLGVFVLLVGALRVRELLGSRIFLNVIMARYRQPVREERVFLMVDVVGSTQYAQRYGDLAAAGYVGQIFKAIAEPIRRTRGSIDDYVGDAALVSWPVELGTRDAACIRCAFAISKAINDEEARWRKSFGQVPRLRMIIHAGPVVTAEVGSDHHKIAYFGDTINTVGRIETLAKAMSAAVIISDEALARFRLPADVIGLPAGSFALKGREGSLALSILSLQGDLQGTGAELDRLKHAMDAPVEFPLAQAG